MKSVEFKHNSSGEGKPQIVLLGNGLERFSGQASWNELLQRININDGINLSVADSGAERQWEQVPFPLLYELLSLPSSSCKKLGKDDIAAQDSRLKNAFTIMRHESNCLLDMLPGLEADHIFTTNYTYCVEKAFSATVFNPSARAAIRFNLNLDK